MLSNPSVAPRALVACRRFQELAEAFRHLAGDETASPTDADAHTLICGNGQTKITTNAGDLIIEVFHAGFLRSIPLLAERVEWHTAIMGSNEIGFVRCSSNLFSDVAGGGKHLTTRPDADGRIAENFGEYGGLLPTAFPEQFSMLERNNADWESASHLRKALACQLLASLLRSEVTSLLEPSSVRDDPQLRSPNYGLIETHDTSDPEPQNLQQFSGGEMVFFQDRVEFCGVDICSSGKRFRTRRKILNLLRKKRSDGSFVGYSGEQLAKEIELSSGQNSAGPPIRDLRHGITKLLRNQANIECGDEDVILSRGRGYRFADCVIVHDGDQPETRAIRDMDDTSGVPNVPDDAAGTRRAWILRQLAEGHELQAPALAKKFKCSVKTAKRDLQALKKEGRIEFVGATRTGCYRLRKPPESDE
jgi:hypothetical protein